MNCLVAFRVLCCCCVWLAFLLDAIALLLQNSAFTKGHLRDYDATLLCELRAECRHALGQLAARTADVRTQYSAHFDLERLHVVHRVWIPLRVPGFRLGGCRVPLANVPACVVVVGGCVFGVVFWWFLWLSWLLRL